MSRLEKISGRKNIITKIRKHTVQNVKITPQLPNSVLALDICGAKFRYLKGKTLSRSLKLFRI